MIPTSSAPACDPRDGACQVCGDVAEVGLVVDMDERSRTGTVAFPGASQTVALDLVDVRPGDRVLVHLGFAIERVGPDE